MNLVIIYYNFLMFFFYCLVVTILILFKLILLDDKLKNIVNLCFNICWNCMINHACIKLVFVDNKIDNMMKVTYFDKNSYVTVAHLCPIF